MSKRWTTFVAAGLAALGVVLFSLTTLLGFERGSQVLLFGAPPQTWLDVLGGAPFVGFPIVGAIVVAKQPRNAVGWLLIASSLGNIVANFSGEYSAAALRWHPGLPAGNLATWLSYWAWTIGSTTVPLVFLLFPDGRFHTRRWRLVGFLAIGNMVVVAFAQMFGVD